MAFQRARDDEQKLERINEIVRATIELYEKDGYDGVTFSRIGKQLSFSRINLYNYFKSKEDIFLLILRRDIEAMVKDADATFKAAATDDESFLQAWAELLLRHQRMLTIFTVVNTIILRGASEEAHIAFRSKMFEQFQRLRDVIRRALPQLSEAQAMMFLEYENSYAMTLFAASLEYKKSQGIAVYPQAGYGTFNFVPQFMPFLRCLLSGVLQSK